MNQSFSFSKYGINYVYHDVAGSILPSYVSEEGLKAYIEDEVFEQTILEFIEDESLLEKYKSTIGNWLIEKYNQNKGELDDLYNYYRAKKKQK